jgi:dihydrolipoamide dehydrogenase
MMDEVAHMADLGVDFGVPAVNIDKLRGHKAQVYDLVLQAVAHRLNGKKLAAEKASVAVSESGFINVDIQMRTPTATAKSWAAACSTRMRAT